MSPVGVESWSTEDFESGRILNMDKPKGMTSFGVVRRIRSMTGCRKVGHAGTLDPMATGVLLVCTGRATKQVPSLMELEKVYEGTVTLGLVTDTDDAEGAVVTEKDVPELSRTELQRALDDFHGDIMQVPPMYSSLKKNGTRLYKLARKGIVIDRVPRRVHVKAIELLDWESPCLRIRVRCSKGTYIRSLARDLGETLGTGGMLSALRRLRVGSYRVEEAYSLRSFEATLREHAVV